MNEPSYDTHTDGTQGALIVQGLSYRDNHGDEHPDTCNQINNACTSAGPKLSMNSYTAAEFFTLGDCSAEISPREPGRTNFGKQLNPYPQ